MVTEEEEEEGSENNTKECEYEDSKSEPKIYEEQHQSQFGEEQRIYRTEVEQQINCKAKNSPCTPSYDGQGTRVQETLMEDNIRSSNSQVGGSQNLPIWKWMDSNCRSHKRRE